MTGKRGQTGICWYDEARIMVRGRDLCADLIGKVSLIDYIYLLVMGQMPTRQQAIVTEAAIVALAEHGLTPSVIAARLTYMGAPETLQGAVAAGLLGVGDQFVGTVEQVAPLLEEIVRSDERVEQAAAKIVTRYREGRKLIPGFGQPHHKPDDPRPLALFAMAEKEGVAGPYVVALKALGAAVDAAAGRHLTINAPAAISALFLEIGIPIRIMRGFVLISRCIGLVGHLAEEQQQPSGRALWEAAAHSVDYSGE
jgi:citrate synthase